MTITTTASSTTVGGNGATTVFSFAFVGDSASDFAVIYTDANGAETTLAPNQYLVALNPALPNALWGVGGTVTYPLMGSPIAAGTTLTIQRILPLTQQVSISNQGDFAPQVTEQALDTLEMQIQQVSARTGQIRGSWITATMYSFGDIVVDGVNGNNTGNLYACAINNTSGVWATDLTNGKWSLALNVQGIIHATPSIANNQVFANISGSPATPIGVGVSALLDSVFSSTQGSILYRGGALWAALPPGTNGYFLETQGASANPQWVAAGGGLGTITGVTAGTGLAGGGTSGNVTVGFGTVANGALLANTSGSTSQPGGTTLSAYLDSVIGSTQGSILYRAGLSWTALAPGSSGQVLETNGAGANPSWGGVVLSNTTQVSGNLPVANLNSGSGASSTTFWRGDGTWVNPASSGALIWLAVVNPSNVGSAVFGSSVITGTYSKYVIEFDSLYLNTAGQSIYMDVSSNNGSTWIASYNVAAFVLASSGGSVTSATYGGSALTVIDIFGNTMSSTPGQGAAGTIKIAVPSASSLVTFDFNCSGVGSGANQIRSTGGGSLASAAAVNAVRFRSSLGNITGNLHLYGLQN